MTTTGKIRAFDAWPLACAGTLLVWLLARLFSAALHGGLNPDPEAAYTLVIARNLAQHGLVTFDGQTFTSGFSTLWLGLLTLKQAYLGPALWITFVAEALMLSTALYLLLRAAPVRTRLFQAAFTAAFAWVAADIGLKGLETSLLALVCSLFIATLAWRTESLAGGVVLGLCGLLCIATRIDMALFVIPALILAPTRLSNRATALGMLLLGLLGYGAIDLIKFGAALPVTAHLRSLGGLQINTTLIGQGFEAYATGGPSARLLLTAGLLAVSPLLVFLTPRDSVARAVSVAAAVAAWALLARLLLFSSWRIGPGQTFVVLLTVTAAYFAIAPALTTAFDQLFSRLGRPRLIQPAPAGLAALVLAALVGQSALAATGDLPPPAGETAGTLTTLIRDHGRLLGGGRIAMGEGGGLLALLYDGPVTAVDGQGGDLAYLNALKAGGDLIPLICARDVRYFAALGPDHGDYRRLRLPVLNPARTHFSGPTVEIDRRDEVVRLPSGGSTLYVWRLGACWRNGYAAVDARVLGQTPAL